MDAKMNNDDDDNNIMIAEVEKAMKIEMEDGELPDNDDDMYPQHQMDVADFMSNGTEIVDPEIDTIDITDDDENERSKSPQPRSVNINDFNYVQWSDSHQGILTWIVITNYIDKMRRYGGPQSINAVHPRIGHNLLHESITHDQPTVFWFLIERCNINPLAMTQSGKTVVELLFEEGKLDWLSRFNEAHLYPIICSIFNQKNKDGKTIQDLCRNLELEIQAKKSDSLRYLHDDTDLIAREALFKRNANWIHYLSTSLILYENNLNERKRLHTFDGTYIIPEKKYKTSILTPDFF